MTGKPASSPAIRVADPVDSLRFMFGVGIECSYPVVEGGVLHRKLREKKVLVRHFARPRIEQYLRITVGTDEQCGALLAALKAILSA